MTTDFLESQSGMKKSLHSFQGKIKEESKIPLLANYVSICPCGKHSLVTVCMCGFMPGEIENTKTNQITQLSGNLSLVRKVRRADTLEHIIESSQCHYKRCQGRDSCFQWGYWEGFLENVTLELIFELYRLYW